MKEEICGVWRNDGTFIGNFPSSSAKFFARMSESPSKGYTIGPENTEPTKEQAWADGYKEGYIEALQDFGIWKDGVQRIGCLETPIKEVIARKFFK